MVIERFSSKYSEELRDMFDHASGWSEMIHITCLIDQCSTQPHLISLFI